MKILAINLPNLNLDYFKDKGLDIEIKHTTHDLKYPLKFLYENENGKFYTPDIHKYLDNTYTKKEYTFILYGYPKDYYPENQSTGGYSYFDPIKSGSFWASVRIDGNENKYAVHEMMHLIGYYINIVIGDKTPKDFMDYTPVGNGVWKPYHLNDFPTHPESNFSKTWENYKKFIPQLKAIKYDMQYKYFSQKEVDTFKLKPELWAKLDEARDLAGISFVITSGTRTPAHNKSVGGASNSAHLTGEGCDIRCRNNEERHKMLRALFLVGINRVGIYDSHIHCDISKTLPQGRVWVKELD